MQITKPEQYFIFNKSYTSFDQISDTIKNKIKKIWKITKVGLSEESWTNSTSNQILGLEPDTIYFIRSNETGYDLDGAVEPINYI